MTTHRARSGDPACVAGFRQIRPFPIGLATCATPAPCSGCGGRGTGCTRGLIRTRRCWRGCGRPGGSICTIRRRAAATRSLAIWKDYLRQQWWRHLVWLFVNGVIAPICRSGSYLAGAQPDRLLVCLPSDPSLTGRLGDPTSAANRIPTDLHPIAGARSTGRDGDDGKTRTRRARRRARRGSTSMWHGMAPPARTRREQTRPSCRRQTVGNPPNYRARSPKTGDHAPSELQHS